MEDNNNNEEILRDTVKTVDGQDNENSNNGKRKAIVAIIIISSILLLVGAIVLLLFFFVINKKEIPVLKGLLERQFPEIKNRFEFTIEESSDHYFEISNRIRLTPHKISKALSGYPNVYKEKKSGSLKFWINS